MFDTEVTRTGDNHPAKDADEGGENGEEGDHQGDGKDTRYREVFDGVDAERAQGIRFLANVHAAQLRGERRRHPAAGDDTRHQGPHLAGHGQRDEVGDIDAGTELTKLDKAHIGHD